MKDRKANPNDANGFRGALTRRRFNDRRLRSEEVKWQLKTAFGEERER